MNRTTGRFYVTNSEFPNTGLLVYDGASNDRIATVPVEGTACALAVNPANNRVYLTIDAGYYGRYGAGRISVLDGATNTKISTITVTSPCDIGVNVTTNRFYVIDQAWNADPSVLVYDGETNELVTSVPLPAGSALHRLAVNSTTNRIYVTDYFGRYMLVIDGETDSVMDKVTIPAGSYTSGLAVNPATNRVYATNLGSDSGNLWVIDGDTNGVITGVVLGGSGLRVAVNPTSNRIYAGQLEVIDGVANTSIGSVPASGASVAAVNPANNRVYALQPPREIDGALVGGRIFVIAECTANSQGNFVCP